MKPIKIGILGLGTVGGGVVNALQRNKDEISRRAGRAIEITHVAVRDLSKARDCDTSNFTLVTDPNLVIEHKDVDIVVELMGGEDETFKLVNKSLNAKKPVITANKALIALHGNELFALAEKNESVISFEAAVAGGIPIIKSIRESLAGNHIQWIAGIINGTCNYILTEMTECKAEFPQALKDAQKKGFAESPPTLDIGGFDAAHKLTILASIAFGIPLQYEKVYIEGITDILLEDILYAGELGYTLKHLGIAKRTAEGIELRVHPTLVPDNCLLASVAGANNAILLHADPVGPSMYYGAGAGAEATASAVIADIIDVTRIITADPQSRVPHLAFQPESLHEYPLKPISATETAYYLRLHVIDRPGVLAEITQALANNGISVKAMLQKGVADAQDLVPVVIETHPVLEENMDDALTIINNINGVSDEVMRLRIDMLDCLENKL